MIRSNYLQGHMFTAGLIKGPRRFLGCQQLRVCLPGRHLHEPCLATRLGTCSKRLLPMVISRLQVLWKKAACPVGSKKSAKYEILLLCSCPHRLSLHLKWVKCLLGR
jgi:hypothetical protein